jgi:hypothetical protein
MGDWAARPASRASYRKGRVSVRISRARGRTIVRWLRGPIVLVAEPARTATVIGDQTMSGIAR